MIRSCNTHFRKFYCLDEYSSYNFSVYSFVLFVFFSIAIFKWDKIQIKETYLQMNKMWHANYEC